MCRAMGHVPQSHLEGNPGVRSCGPGFLSRPSRTRVAGLVARPAGCRWRTGLRCPIRRCAPIESVPQSHFPVLLTGRQCPCSQTRHPSQYGSVPRVAHRPSAPHVGAVICSASWALFSADIRSCSDRRPSHFGPFIRVSESLQAIPGELDVTPLAVAGSRPATDHSVQCI
jgi:hypothetical protein